MPTLEAEALRETAAEWQAYVSSVDTRCREILHRILTDHIQDLCDRYVAFLTKDREIASVIPTDAGRQEITELFLKWIEHLLMLDPDAVDEYCERQKEVGRMMARIGLPPYALSRSMRKLKLWFISHLGTLPLSSEQLLETVKCLVFIIDISVEIRAASFYSRQAKHARLEETYRLQALCQNLAMEKERQRAALMEWVQHILTSFCQSGDIQCLPLLGKSDFGLWLDHKARLLFEGAMEVGVIVDAVTRIDTDLVPALESAVYAERNVVGSLIAYSAGDSLRQIQPEQSFRSPSGNRKWPRSTNLPAQSALPADGVDA
ncbi:protoglobin domain-containing protein [Paracidobacterium acidisoli]|uniref:protoglobin domain-containing protein n=1 Tax=Paracidobacterium acidisoli TaxID=2303751 RepID=UPI001314E6D4|nr:protoglobin domain-containing protein [Paracidobacterium acidisoli]MBT9330914.1 hypothetical protein [Paracidobacterium acidisoli]